MDLTASGDTSPTRVYSTLSIKSYEDEARTIFGIASTPSTDRQGDRVEPMGGEYRLPLPLLWQHRIEQPIGNVTAAKATASGIEFSAQLARVGEPGPLRDRLELAWQHIRAGLIRGVSIGFSPIEEARLPSGGTHYKRWRWLELSAVTIPANEDASITRIKSIYEGGLAAARRAGEGPASEFSVQTLQQKHEELLTAIQSAHKAGNRDLWAELLEADDELQERIAAAQVVAVRRSVGLPSRRGAEEVLQGRVEQLERALDRRVKRLDQAWERKFRGFQDAVVAVLRDHQKQAPPIRYRGVHQRAEHYGPSDVVTFDGSAWIALKAVEPGGERPGEGGHWQMFVKRGRDGKDGTR